MCGISGIYALSKKRLLGADDYSLLNRRLYHRGPDQEGVLSADKIIMGHSRLAITDFSNLASQPMVSTCDSCAIVFNGEIYNYVELRKEIEKTKPDLVFRSQSDTEVLLESFILWGARAVYKWNGMFSVAIWDKRNNSLWIFRDRMGEKPLYYYRDGHHFAFASELKFIEQLPFFNKEINQESVHAFLQLGFIPNEHTIYSNVHKLQAGHYIHIQKDEIEIHPYWRITDSIDNRLIEDEKIATNQLENLLSQSVCSRLSPSLRNGIFLSGGIDSSLITAIAAKHHSGNIKTFSLGFAGQLNNETVHAEKISNFLGLEHQSVMVNVEEVKQEIEGLEDVFDEPFADSSAIAVLLLAKYAKKEVKIILSGEGGDELFWGYGRFRWTKMLEQRYLWGIRKILPSLLKYGNKRMKKAACVFSVDHKCQFAHLLSCDQDLFTSKELDRCQIPNTIDSGPVFSTDRRQLNLTEQQGLFELSCYLKDDLLVKLDRSAMSHSLESRCPFLDMNLVAFALNLSPLLKIEGWQQKYLLKKVLFRYLPEHFFQRPKQGFSIPLQQWLKADLKYLTSEYLNSSLVKKAGWFTPKYIDELKRAFNSGKDHLYNRLWTVMLLHKWFSRKILSVSSFALVSFWI